MVEIKCSKMQKRRIIKSLLSPEGCLWPRSQIMCAYDYTRSCKDCFEKRIKWVLTDEKNMKKNED